jgi:zinc/manganese transport system permease protein
MTDGFSWNLIADLRVMLQYEFIRNAFEAGTIIAIVAGIVSYLVVLRRSSFAAHALGHVGFSGAAGAVLFGVNPIYGLLLFTTVSGTGIAVLGSKASHRDVEIGTVLAFMLGLGLLFLSFYRGYATEAYSILFGEIVGISNSQVVFTYAASIPVLVALGLVYRQLLFASLDEDVAEAKGMHMLLLGVIFMLALAVAVSIAVTVIGVLLIFALTVTPAAIAIRLAKRPLYAVALAVLIALGAMWAGIFIGFYEIEPTSFFIVTIVFVAYVLVRAVPLVPPLLNRLAPSPATRATPVSSTPVPAEPLPDSGANPERA